MVDLFLFYKKETISWIESSDKTRDGSGQMNKRWDVKCDDVMDTRSDRAKWSTKQLPSREKKQSLFPLSTFHAHLFYENMRADDNEIESLVEAPESESGLGSSSRPNRAVNSSYRRIQDGFLRCWLHVADTGRLPILLAFLVLSTVLLGLSFSRSSPIPTPDPSNPLIHPPVINDTKHDNTRPHQRPSWRPSSSPTYTAPPTLLPGQTKAPISRSQKIQAQINLWGKWHFWDNVDPATRPALSSYVSLYPNGDVPYKAFPPRAWQGDAVYVNHFLDSASELVIRAKEVIYTEYGWGPKATLTREQITQRPKFFKLNKRDITVDTPLAPGWEVSGGWTTPRTFLSLSRRLLHCMMTRCEFTMVVGGGSAKAMGLGNHFSQSYLMQFQQLMNPVFQRLGMKLTCRNMASVAMNPSWSLDRNNTGQVPITASSIHSALGFRSIYGDDVDVFIWDGDEHEAQNDAPELDLLYRQALMSPKAPILVGGSYNLLRLLYLHADADVMALGNASSILKTTLSAKQALTLPWAMRFIKCEDENQSLCDDPMVKYLTRCWVHRDDVNPPLSQDEFIRTPSNDLPGFRQHLLQGRVLAMAILDALEDAIASWSSSTMMGGHPLGDQYWHIGSYYDNIHTKVKALNDTSIGTCHKIQQYLPQGVCTVPMKAKTECTPRFDPDRSSIRSIIKPGVDGYIPGLTESMLYEGPDEPNKWLQRPDEALDVEQILSNRRLSPAATGRSEHRFVQGNSTNLTYPWHITGSLPGTCDGQIQSTCGRLRDSTCLLHGHVDSRGGISGDDSSGSLELMLDQIENGIIVFFIDDSITSIVSSDNEEVTVDISVNGVVTTISNLTSGFVTVMGRSTTTSELKNNNTTLGVQVRHCRKPSCSITLTHIYWS